MSSFRDAVAASQPLFAGATNEAYIAHRDRLVEAAHVELCVERAVEGELDITGYRALGRLTRFSPPALGNYLNATRRYSPEDPVAAAAIADTTRCVMALGWLFACTPDAPAAERSARDVWDFWAGPSLRDTLSEIVPKDLASLIHQRGASLLGEKLSAVGLKRRRPSSKLPQIGYQIVQHGFYLRMVQSTEIDEAAFRRVVAERRETGIGSADGRWDWDAYACRDRGALPA
jgi:hypothetical protein